jgi:hypothetical protein
MQVRTRKVIGKLVKVVNYDSSYKEIIDYKDDPWAFPMMTPDWQDYAYQDEYFHCSDVCFIPIETLGLIIDVAPPYHGMILNFVKVLFPGTQFDSVDSIWNANSSTNPAGAYWISGDFLEEVESEE